MSRVRWGIVSAGHIANTFASDAKLVANAEVTAVAARRLGDAQQFAAQHGIARAYEGYEALYSDPDVDAIYVATPHTLHFENSVDALRARKAVLCEKPLSVSADECRALTGVAAETGGYLMEALWTWFLPALRQAKRWVDEGRIGELRHLRAELGYPKPFDPASRLYDPQLAGGCLLDMGIYPIAIARYFTGRAPQDVEVVARCAPNGVDDDVTMLFDYGDCVAQLATSFRCKLPNITYVVGTEGYIAMPDGWRATDCRLYRGDELVDSFTEERRGTGFEHQVAAVGEDILERRKESRIVTHAASLAFQEDMDRVRRQFR